MGEQPVWAVLIGACGGERARVQLYDAPERDMLPLRRVAEAGLTHDAAAVILVRIATSGACAPCPAELGAIQSAKHTLDQIGLRLHDYILWHGERCVSLRANGRL